MLCDSPLQHNVHQLCVTVTFNFNYKEQKTLNLALEITHAVAVRNNEANEPGTTRVTPYSFTRVNSNKREKEF